MIYRKISILLIYILSICILSCAQSTEVEIDHKRLKAQASVISEAFIKADYETFVKFTYSKLVQMMGGKDSMISILKEGIEQMKNEGFTFKSVNIGLTSSGVKAGKEIHTLVSQTIVMNVPGGTMTAKSYLLAISQDGGKNWQFVDTAPLNDTEKLKTIFPEYNLELKIPEKQLPIFKKSE